jgi:hypothetical protein
MKVELIDGASAGSISACYPSGWIQTDIRVYVYTEWFYQFFHFFKPSTYDPLWLIVDRHYSHAKNLDMVDKTRNHSVAIVSLPSRQWLKICKSSGNLTHSLSNSKIFCSHKPSQTTNSELYKFINSFSFQTTVAGESKEESLVAVKETNNKKAF